jgi:quercetin dioxygenase-like cupin family protein
MTENSLQATALWHAGMRLRVLMNADLTAGHFALCEWHAPPGAATPIHRHEHEDEVVYVRAGELEVWQHGTSHVLTAGASMVMPRGLPHRLVNRGGSMTEFLVAIVPGGFELTLARASSPDVAFPLDPDDVAALFAGAGVSIYGWQAREDA